MGFVDACWCLEWFCGIDYVQLASDPVKAMATHADELNAVIDKIRMSVQTGWPAG
jgi:hypothetical protein